VRSLLSPTAAWLKAKREALSIDWNSGSQDRESAVLPQVLEGEWTTIVVTWSKSSKILNECLQLDDIILE
jgi:hypothetical protein